MSSNGLNHRISRLDQYRAEKNSLGSNTITTLLDTNSSSSEADSDIVFTIKKKLIQFWNEPEYVTVKDEEDRKRKQSEDTLV